MVPAFACKNLQCHFTFQTIYWIELYETADILVTFDLQEKNQTNPQQFHMLQPNVHITLKRYKLKIWVWGIQNSEKRGKNSSIWLCKN